MAHEDAPEAATGSMLRVEPATAEHLQALIDGPGPFTAAFGLDVAERYVEFDGVLEWSLAQVTDGGADPSWHTYLFVYDDRVLVGIGGFKGPTTDGWVEIGDAVAPAYRGRGLATAAARALVNRARDAGVTMVVAHTVAEPNASTRVLARAGFERTGEIESPEDGTIWRWEKPVRKRNFSPWAYWPAPARRSRAGGSAPAG